MLMISQLYYFMYLAYTIQDNLCDLSIFVQCAIDARR